MGTALPLRRLTVKYGLERPRCDAVHIPPKLKKVDYTTRYRVFGVVERQNQIDTDLTRSSEDSQDEHQQ